MILDTWAKKYNLPQSAIDELKNIIFNTDSFMSSPRDKKSEAAVLNDIRLEASIRGARLWRNNVGAATTDTGSFIRYGLANESSNQNKIIKSADLIGLRSVLITQEMIGHTIGQFLSREIKTPGWKYRGGAREQAQLAWLNLINALGGDARFVTGVGSL